MSTLIFIFMILVFDASTLAMDTTPATLPHRTTPNPWYFRPSLGCRPLKIHLQKILNTERTCENACQWDLLALENVLRGHPEKCYRGGNICESFSSILLSSNASFSERQDDDYSHHNWADAASSVHNTIHDDNPSSSTANIGCMLSFNIAKQKKKKKNAKKVVSMQDSLFNRCKCDKYIYYQSVLVDESCLASAIRSRHETNGWQVVGNKDEETGEQDSCNELDCDKNCPLDIRQKVLVPESSLNNLARSFLEPREIERRAMYEMERHDRNLGEGSAVNQKKPYRDEFENAILRIYKGQTVFPGTEPNPGKADDPLDWSDQQSDSDPDC